MSERARTNAVTAHVSFETTWIPRVSPDPRDDVETLRSQWDEAQRVSKQTRDTIVGGGHQIYEWVSRINREFSTASPIAKSGLGHKAASEDPIKIVRLRGQRGYSLSA